MSLLFQARSLSAAALITAASVSGIALAQAQGDRPDSHERELAQIIAGEGHSCPQIESVSTPQSSEPGWDILRPEVVVCRNGNRFMIVTSGRRNARPIVRPLPSIGQRL